jgi:hypothetical protein
MKKKKKKKRKMTKGKGKGPRKGSAFEREFCKELSLWWSENKRDDLFWRTAGSGARATRRIRQSKVGTFGQYGDVQATDPAGQPLLDLFTIELKKGYNTLSVQDLLDRTIKQRQSTTYSMEKMIKQAMESALSAGTPAWMLVWKRDRREAVLLFPKIRLLSDLWSLLRRPTVHGTSIMRLNIAGLPEIVMVTTWNELLEIDPTAIQEIHEYYNDKRRRKERRKQKL